MNKAIFGISLVLLVCVLVFAAVWFGWWYPKNYEYALKLADDASLPKVKAEYLKEYLQAVGGITGQPAYIFMRKDLELNRQREILKGLIERFEDIAKIEPSNMAYQQGMYQLSGQEINHQLERTSDIFESAKLRENPLIFFIFCWGWLIFGAIALISGFKIFCYN